MQARTYPDLLKSPHDEALMEYYCQSSLVYIDVRPLSHLIAKSLLHCHVSQPLI